MSTSDAIFAAVAACLGVSKTFRPNAPWWQLCATIVWSALRLALDEQRLESCGPHLVILAVLLLRAIWSVGSATRGKRSVRRSGARYKIA